MSFYVREKHFRGQFESARPMKYNMHRRVRRSFTFLSRGSQQHRSMKIGEALRSIYRDYAETDSAAAAAGDAAAAKDERYPRVRERERERLVRGHSRGTLYCFWLLWTGFDCKNSPKIFTYPGLFCGRVELYLLKADSMRPHGFYLGLLKSYIHTTFSSLFWTDKLR